MITFEISAVVPFTYNQCQCQSCYRYRNL